MQRGARYGNWKNVVSGTVYEVFIHKAVVNMNRSKSDPLHFGYCDSPSLPGVWCSKGLNTSSLQKPNGSIPRTNRPSTAFLGPTAGARGLAGANGSSFDHLIIVWTDSVYYVYLWHVGIQCFKEPRFGSL